MLICDSSLKSWWLYVSRVVCSIPYYLLRSMGFVIIFLLSFLLLVAYIFSFSLAVLLEVSQFYRSFKKKNKTDFIWLVFEWYTFFFLLLTYLYCHYIWSQFLINSTQFDHVIFIHSDYFFLLMCFDYLHLLTLLVCLDLNVPFYDLFSICSLSFLFLFTFPVLLDYFNSLGIPF